MRKVTVLFEGDINRRLGVFNAVVNRVKHLREIADADVVVRMMQVYDGRIVSLLRGSKRVKERPATIEAEGITIDVCWIKRHWLDSLMHKLFHRRPKMLMRKLQRLSWELRGASVVLAHDRMAAYVGEMGAKELGIPCFVTWHGASIYTDPVNDEMIREVTIELLQGATCNWFVSRGLVDKAQELTTQMKWDVLLNGASPAFYRLDDDTREQLRRSHGVMDGQHVVAYVGRFEPVKNVTMLPELFQAIQRRSGQGIAFWTIGDGVQHSEVVTAMKAAGINCHHWGAQPPESMPQWMNCIDLLVLPSSLEGLPLVVIEALQCGAHVVASDVVGTAEAIGKENAFALDEHFIDNVSERAAQMLRGEVTQSLPAQVSWAATARKEWSIIAPYVNG